MSAAAPGDFFKRKANAKPQVRKVKRFSDIESDSDFEIEEDRRSRPSPPSLSFKTDATERVVGEGDRAKSIGSRNFEATSESSIHFDSASEVDLAAAPAPATVAEPPPAQPETAAAPPAHQPPPQSSAQSPQQSLAEKLFGNIGALRKGQPVQQEQPAAAAPPKRPSPEGASKSLPLAPTVAAAPEQRDPPAPAPAPTPAVKAVPQRAPVPAPAQPVAAPEPQPPQRPQRQQQQQQALQQVQQPQQPQQNRSRGSLQNTPPAEALTEAYDGTGAISREQSYVRQESYEDDKDTRSDGGFADSVLPAHPTSTAARTQLPAPSSMPSPQGSLQQPVYVTPHRTERGGEEGSTFPKGSSSERNVYAGAFQVGGGGNPIHRDPSEELLVRARLRLEEKRRTESAAAVASRSATPKRGATGSVAGNAHLPTGSRGVGTPHGSQLFASTPASPRESAVPLYGYRDAAPTPGAGFSSALGRPNGFVAALPAPHMVEAKLRRLTQENTRLQDEVSFLSRENQRMRAIAGSVDSAENIKMQLTVDMLRKELQSKELDHQNSLREAEGEKSSLANQVRELQDQNEGYIATAAQYKGLYEEKVKEIEQLKLQLQRVVHDVSSLEHRQQNSSQQHEGELAAEREKVDKLLYLLEDVKRQRQHLHELNQQLQLEVAGVNDEKSRLKAAVEAAEEKAKQAKAVSDQTAQTLRQDVVRLKDALTEKERGHAAQLREEQRANAVLQQRLDEAVADAQQEAGRLRRALDAAREDHKRALGEERERRAAVEERLRQTESDSKAAMTAFKESVASDNEKRARRMREDLVAERNAREAAQLEAERAAEEAARVREELAYHTEQYQGLAADFAHSEQMRDKAERQCGELTATLHDLMQQDEGQTRHIGHLEAAVADLRRQLGEACMYPTVAGDGAGPGGAVGGVSPYAAQMQLLSAENERLTNECVRLAGERDTLIDENGKIADELLKWKNEMRRFVSAQLKPGSA